MKKSLPRKNTKSAKAQEVVSSDAEGRLSDNPEFIRQAFSHYCNGLSLVNVAKLMKPEWPGVGERMLQRLAQDNGWADFRTTMIARLQEVEIDSRVMVQGIIMDLERMRKQLDARSSLSPQFLNAYMKLCDSLLWYTGKHPKLKHDGPLVLSDDEYIKAFRDVLQKHKVIGPLLKRYSSDLKERVELLIDERRHKAKAIAKKAGKR